MLFHSTGGTKTPVSRKRDGDASFSVLSTSRTVGHRQRQTHSAGNTCSPKGLGGEATPNQSSKALHRSGKSAKILQEVSLKDTEEAL